ncbi:MAG: hypothetical protein H7328_02175 [Bdellovibrio sp.]|nr:hypothetical protein [Bdellovibrio sp.]
MFLTGPRSLFFYEMMGQNLQDFLAAHGYQVLSVPLPFRHPRLRKLAFTNWLTRNCGKKFHFFIGPETFKEFKTELETHPDSTLTIFGPDSDFNDFKFKNAPLNYRLHQLFCWLMLSKAERYADTLPLEKLEDYDRFLDHCVHLAEDELMENQL